MLHFLYNKKTVLFFFSVFLPKLTLNSDCFSDMPQLTPPFLLSLHAIQLSLLLPLFLPPLEFALWNEGENPAFALPNALAHAAAFFAGIQSSDLLSFFIFIPFEGPIQIGMPKMTVFGCQFKWSKLGLFNTSSLYKLKVFIPVCLNWARSIPNLLS